MYALSLGCAVCIKQMNGAGVSMWAVIVILACCFRWANSACYLPSVFSVAVGTCVLCPNGAFWQDSNTCIGCSVGKYSSFPSIPCQPCDKGMYGSTSYQSVCIWCPYGSVQPNTGTTFCSRCPDGSTNDDLRQSCVPCSSGRYTCPGCSDPCPPCPIGSVQPNTGVSFCTRCSAGMTNDNMRQYCIPCPVGTYGVSTGSNPCPSCLVGTIQGNYATPGGYTVCASCPLGMTSDPTFTTCLRCDPGTYAAILGPCLKCPSGMAQMYGGSTYCDACSPGQTNDATSANCVSCLPGTYNTVKGPCLSCPQGMFQSLEGSTVCTACLAGTFNSNVGKSVCSTCPAGTYNNGRSLTVCQNCPLGLVSDLSSTACVTCSPGTYGSLSGQCSICASGTFQTGTGTSACQSCSIGQTNDALFVGCVACSPGTYSSAIGLCYTCSSGTVQTGIGGTVCRTCSPGQTNDYTHTSCASCLAGTYSSSSGMGQCTACSLGMFQTGLGYSVCYLCLPGQISNTVAPISCSLCQKGTFTSIIGSSICSGCAAGTYASGIGYSVCLQCPPGQTTMSAVQCGSCLPGTFSGLSGQSACLGCTFGTYTTATQSSSCLQCLPGQFGNTLVAVGCSTCLPGTFSSVSGSSVCLSCTMGTYSTGSSSALCQSCSAGQYMSLTGQTSVDVCTQCFMGTYASSTGLSSCVACGPGQLSNPIFTACITVTLGTPCPSGAYALSGGGCAYCAAGTFVYFSGASGCQPCPPNTGSAVGASVCVSCGIGCKMASGVACPLCTSSCTACKGGTYNDGTTKKCVGCSAGTFSKAIHAQSSAVCSRCDSGFSTSPFDSGMSSCVTCASLNQSMPLNALNLNSNSPLVCNWDCKQGYIRIVAGEGTFQNSSYVGYTYTQARDIFHIQNDYCCTQTILSSGTSTSYIGMYLTGCNRSSDGIAAPCPPITNGYYVGNDTNKINYCSDWQCNANAYNMGTMCVLQPICKPGYTFNRNANGDTVSLPNGPNTCVLCSLCMDGSQMLIPCNGTMDTQCIKCSEAGFSASGSVCITATLPGYITVRVRLSKLPPFQGRPNYYSNGALINWAAMDFTSGVFFNSFTKCRPLTDPALMYTGQGDFPCQGSDTSTSMCIFPVCNTQCKPWNGTVGWFMLSTGQCTACVYDNTCATNQYSNMAVCGPTSAPQCTPCPTLLPLNVLNWVNPGRVLIGYPPCDVVCRNGYVKTSNFSCIFCPNTPNNSRITTGCNWVCSLGYFQSGSVCLPCTNTPTTCGVGTYLGYSSTQCGFNGQCPCCMLCTNTVTNALFTSNGTINGPNTCRVACNRETFVDPIYGLDVFGNPVGCIPCSNIQCTVGASYLVGCTQTTDSFCTPCSVCSPGMQISTPCTTGADTTCMPCNSTPANAIWVVGCSQWQCQSGFYLKGELCLACRQPRDCSKNDRFDYISSTCGTCSPCNTSRLLPWQCFNGDGQCGTTYFCGFTTTRAVPTSSYVSTVSVSNRTTPFNTTAVYMNQTSSNATTSGAMPYAAVMTLTLPSQISLQDVIKAISCPQQKCEIKIVSVTFNSTTTYCVGSGCVQRRLLVLENTTMVLEIVIITQEPLLNQPIVNISINPASVSTTASYQVVNSAMLSNTQQLSSFIKASSNQITPSEYQPPWVAIVVLVIVGLALIAGLIFIFTRPKPVVAVEMKSEFDWSGVRLKYV